MLWVVPPTHFEVGHVTSPVPELAESFVTQTVIVWPLAAFEKVNTQVFPEVSVTVKALPVDQSTVRAVVQAVSA